MAAHADMLDDAEFTRFLLRILSEKLPTLTFEEIKAMIGPTLVKFEDTQFYKDLQAKEQEATQRGLQNGLQQGLQQGDRRRQEAVAHKMLNMGLNLEQIAEATDLSIDEVRLLAQ